MTDQPAYDRADVVDLNFVREQARIEGVMREWDFSDEDIRLNRAHHGGKLYLCPLWFAALEPGYYQECNDSIFVSDHVEGWLEDWRDELNDNEPSRR